MPIPVWMWRGRAGEAKLAGLERASITELEEMSMSESETKVPASQSEYNALTAEEQAAAVASEIRRLGEARGESEESIQQALRRGTDVIAYCAEGDQWEDREYFINGVFDGER